MATRSAIVVRVVVALALGGGVAGYTLNAAAVDRELRRGEAAFTLLCDRLLQDARGSGSPGAVGRLVPAMQAGLADLESRFPRWYGAYQKDPARYTCGPRQPNTQVGSDR